YDPACMRMTRRLSRAILDDQNVVDDDIDDVETIIDELCTNVIRHSQSESACFTLEMRYFLGRVTIVVVDAGQNFCAGELRGVGEERKEGGGSARIGGYGLLIVRHLCDVVHFRSTMPHGTTVEAEKHLHYTYASQQPLLNASQLALASGSNN
ncbi:MAG: ATP-binding protein, partial [Capsulimonadaceae bacterium]